MSNFGWNGSTLTFGGAGVTPLVDLHQPNDPADFDTTGSEDATHTHGTGLPKNSFTASFLGSQCPKAGTIADIDSSIGASDDDGGDPTEKSYDQAIITQMSVNGRKDGRIEGSLTAMPADTSLTAEDQTWDIGDLGFNGSTFKFDGHFFADVVSIAYTSSVQPVESVGATDSTGEAAPDDNLYVPGIPEETLTVTTLGGPQCDAKDTGDTAVTWNDGGDIGTIGDDDVTAMCMSTNPGGSLDGQATTEHVFKPTRNTDS